MTPLFFLRASGITSVSHLWLALVRVFVMMIWVIMSVMVVVDPPLSFQCQPHWLSLTAPSEPWLGESSSSGQLVGP